MAMQLSRKPFGSFTRYTIGTKETHLSFVPERSAYIHQIRLNGIDTLDNYGIPRELEENSSYKNHALLPFPNRLLGGEYSWRDQAYSFEINNNSTRSALHGFGASVPFVVERFDLSAKQASVKLTYLHRPADHPKSYPFLVRFDLELGLDLSTHTASWKFAATNLGSVSISVGLGWHPYFLLPGGFEHCTIELPANEQVVLVKAMPSGERKVGWREHSIDTNWDDCFALTNTKDLEVRLLGPTYSLLLKQIGTTRYTQIYVPGDRTSIAIEPMTCGVNAFNMAIAEVELSPKQILETGMEISLLGG